MSIFKKCEFCGFEELTIINSPTWPSDDMFSTNEIRIDFECENCGYKYSTKRDFNSFNDYITYIEKYE